jgi:hypothetical protein
MTTPSNTTMDVGRSTYRGSSVNTQETKPAFKTTELIVLVLGVIAVLIAANVVTGFDATHAWLYVTIMGSAYMLSRGIAKSGSYAKDEDPRANAYSDDR